MSITKTLAAGLKQTRGSVPTTARIERVTEMASAVRVVATFNKAPTSEDAKRLLEVAFDNKLEVVPGSFRQRRALSGDRVTVAGFLREKIAQRPAEDVATAGFKEVASNVFMDPTDNSIWSAKDGMIVRNQTESLAELASIAPVQKRLHDEAPLAVAMVKPFVGPKNTQMVAFVDPEDPSNVKVGFRVSDTAAWSEEDGVTELSEDIIVDTEMLDGADYEEATFKAIAAVDQQGMIDYYAQVYAYDPAYYAGVQAIINQRALV